MTSDILEEIKKEILQKLPDEIQVSKVEFEGPEVVVYTKNPEIITENGDLIRSLAKELRKKHETVISNQISRSATSVCANIAESKYGHSRADFIAKLEIALKEVNETSKWLEMLFRSEYIGEATFQAINKTCTTIRILLIASCKTAKKNGKID